MNDDEEREYKNEKEFSFSWGYSITTRSGKDERIKDVVFSISNKRFTEMLDNTDF